MFSFGRVDGYFWLSISGLGAYTVPTIKHERREIARLLNRPERKWLSCFKARIFVVNEVKPAFVTETGGRLVFSEDEGIE